MDPTTGTRALTVACCAFVTVPNLGALLGRGEQTDRYDTVVTPPSYAFAIWGPIFATCAGDALRRWRDPSTHEASDAATAAPLAAAYALNTAWSIAAQGDRFELTPGLLLAGTACAAVAHHRIQSQDGARPSTVAAAGLLLGWTALASAVNVSADVVRRGAPAEGPLATRSALVAVVAAAGVVAGTIAGSRRGRGPVAAAAGWGLLTTATDPSRPRSSRIVAAVSAAGVGAALATRHSR